MSTESPVSGCRLQDALIAKQRELGEPDAVFAGRLGIDRTYWTRLRTGRALPPKMVPRIVQLFPDLLRHHLLDIQTPEDGA